MKSIKHWAESTTPNDIETFIDLNMTNITLLKEGKVNSYRFDVYSRRKKHYTVEVSKEILETFAHEITCWRFSVQDIFLKYCMLFLKII